jgi:hypothetical protein
VNLEPHDLDRFVDELVDAGIRGLEGYHGDWSLEEQQPLRDMAKAKGLIASGGSDYHGSMRPDRGLPGGRHGVGVPPEVLEQLRAAVPSGKAI